jgi:ATP-binding cassette subfamily B protein IrtA
MRKLKAEGKMMILSTHRLSTVMNAGIILVFKKGEIIKCGTHEKLMETCEEYLRMREGRQAVSN